MSLQTFRHRGCAASIVPVEKKDGNISVCGDFSTTFNACAEVISDPIPQIEDLHTALSGCSIFTTLDISQAYHQIPVSKSSQKYLTINTHIGLFQFIRMLNGIHSGPTVFQQVMDTVLSGVPKPVSQLDGILCAGVDHEDHLNTISLVL